MAAATGKMVVWLKRGANEEAAEVEVTIYQAYSPDVLADMSRHAVTAVGAMFPEDDDEDLLDRLETSYREPTS